MEITAESLSSAITTFGEKVDFKWFDKLKSQVSSWFDTPKVNTKDVKKAQKESWSQGVARRYNDLKGWIKNVLGKAKGAKVPGSEALYGILKAGDDNIGALTAGAAATTAAAAAIGIQATTGVTVPEMVEKLLDFGETVWEFNWSVSDKEIWEQIKGLINGLYGTAGQFVGSNLARLLVGGTSSLPKIQINMRSLTLSWMVLEEKEAEAMLQSISTFAWQGIFVAKEILFRFAFIQGREAIKKLYENNKELFKQLYPDLAKAIPNWGKEGQDEWTIAAYVDKKVESINEDRIEAFVKGALSGFWNEFRNGVEYKFDR